LLATARSARDDRQHPWDAARGSEGVCVIEAGGVGYAIQVSVGTFTALPEPGAEVRLHTRHIVREDAQLLFGFTDRDELRLFDLLIGVNGVGPRIAIAVLSGLAPARFARAVRDEDLAAITAINGVGRKTAERLVIELRDKLGFLPVAAAAPSEAAPCAVGDRPRCSRARSATRTRWGRSSRSVTRRRRRPRPCVASPRMAAIPPPRPCCVVHSYCCGPDADEPMTPPKDKGADDAARRAPAEVPAHPQRLADPAASGEDVREEKRLRPLSLGEFVGQAQVREQMGSRRAARQRGESDGSRAVPWAPGLGKTTLASIVAHELGVEITHTERSGHRAARRPRRPAHEHRPARHPVRG
jgi:hypothetical protein